MEHAVSGGVIFSAVLFIFGEYLKGSCEAICHIQTHDTGFCWLSENALDVISLRDGVESKKKTLQLMLALKKRLAYEYEFSLSIQCELT